jgi:SpoVK/Ycf46/Vps4 family AAA+-type ATPase
VRAADQFWTAAARTFRGLNLSNSKLRLYQDGLPVCGQEEAIVAELARQAAPCIIFLGGVDAPLPMRGVGGSDSHLSERVLSQFLAELDGIEELKGVLGLGATNRLDILDLAGLRPGRLTAGQGKKPAKVTVTVRDLEEALEARRGGLAPRL